MELKLVWSKPIPLIQCRADVSRIYDVNLEAVPPVAGLYMFMRAFGRNKSPLYIGRAGNLRARVEQHLNSIKLMKGILNAANGSRVLLVAEFIPKQAQNRNRCIQLIERALIRHYLSDGYELLNKSGTRLANHSLVSEKVAGRFIPRKILFE
jgi:hypothetical protein